MISKPFLNSKTSTKSTTTDRPFQRDIWCGLLFTQLSILQETIQYGAYLPKGERPAPRPPQTSLFPALGWAQHSAAEKVLDKSIPTKSHEVSFGSVGQSRRRIQELGSEEAGAGQDCFFHEWSVVGPDWSALWNRSTKATCTHRWTPQSHHPDIPNGYAKFRPRKKWLSTLSNAFLLKWSMKVTSNSAISSANEERDSNRT